MRVSALTAHGRCDLRQAEAFVIDWFEAEGLELTLDQDGVLIGWNEDFGQAGGFSSAVAVEVRFYRLDADWIQARWTIRLGEAGAAPGAEQVAGLGTGSSGLENLSAEVAQELIASLRSHLHSDARWCIDDP